MIGKICHSGCVNISDSEKPSGEKVGFFLERNTEPKFLLNSFFNSILKSKLKNLDENLKNIEIGINFEKIGKFEKKESKITRATVFNG